MYGGMIEIHNMFKINNKAPVCLEKAVFWELFQPVVHIMNGVKILPFLGKALLMVALIYLVIQMKSSEIQPFIYFQF